MKPCIKRLTTILSLGLCLCGPLPCSADDYESEHRVKPGDVISADMINELFDRISEFRKTITEEDLIGVWKGTAYTTHDGGGQYWSYESSNAVAVLYDVEISFTRLPNGAMQMQTSAPNPFYVDSASAVTRFVAVREGMLFMGHSGAYRPRIIDRISPTRIRLLQTIASAAFIENPGPSFAISLDRQNITPKKPKLLSAKDEPTGVELTWLDQSGNETGFNILRRHGLGGTYQTVGTVISNTTSFVDTSTSSGYSWYRITSTNTYGESVGSNVKRVVVP